MKRRRPGFVEEPSWAFQPCLGGSFNEKERKKGKREKRENIYESYKLFVREHKSLNLRSLGPKGPWKGIKMTQKEEEKRID